MRIFSFLSRPSLRVVSLVSLRGGQSGIVTPVQGSKCMQCHKIKDKNSQMEGRGEGGEEMELLRLLRQDVGASNTT